jgi:hypothetical protein
VIPFKVHIWDNDWTAEELAFVNVLIVVKPVRILPFLASSDK